MPRHPSPQRLPESRIRLDWPGKRPPCVAGHSALRWTDAHPPRDSAVGPGYACRNRLIEADNLFAMRALLPEFAGRVDLVYLDPPFNAGQTFRAALPAGDAGATTVSAEVYRDVWEPAEYLQMLYERLWMVRELLAETGSLILHVDWRVAPLAQVVLDELFGGGEREGQGKPGFRNEIVWGYGGGGSLKTAYRRKHDNLFWYTRSGRWTFNPQYRPYTAGTRSRGLTAVKGDRYALREEGATLESWWTGPEVQKILSPTAHENLKFPTQKPEALLERILLGHSNEGDLVADFFCGSGTTGAVAERLGRRWVMADSSPVAVHLARKRLVEIQDSSAPPVRSVGSDGSVGSQGEERAFDLYRLADAPGRSPAPGWGSLSPRVVHAGAHREVTLEGEGLDRVDYWAVEPEYGALRAAGGEPVFRHGLRRYRSTRKRKLETAVNLRAGAAGLPLAVKAVDVLGSERLWVLGEEGGEG
jgi:hypothetical protein